MTSRRILVVEDDPLMLEMIMLRVEMLGHQAQFARHGIQALEKVLAFRPDAMILDLEMPYLDGFGVLERLGSAKIARLPTLIISARRDVDDVSRAVWLGARDYLMKPFKPEVLQKRIERLVLGCGSQP